MTPMIRVDDAELRRLRWRCRRGLLENDLVLTRFLDRYAQSLDERALRDLNELLAFDDPTLWDLLSGRAEPDPRLTAMVQRLRRA
jgi:succinate dehydrogenase flavin-adding protein (antitoxin of CptAB toxin-antitoxin module)